MWTFDEHGNANNGVDKAIFIQVELRDRFDVFLHEKTDDGIKVTPLAWYLFQDEAREYVRSFVTALEDSE